MFTTFIGGAEGSWQVTSVVTVRGAALRQPTHLNVMQTLEFSPLQRNEWRLTGVASHVRYVERREKTDLVQRQAGLGRSEASCAALLPISKSVAWWDLPQDERREIFETQSHHIAGSLKYLPAIARQLYHCRDLGEEFDFLTWFEFAPEHAAMFDELLINLRASAEWRFVEREVDIRLRRV